MRSEWFMGKIKTIHFIGMGGIGMSGLAEILLNLGFRVQGSDVKSSSQLERLQMLGATVFIGHHGEHVAGADVVVYSSAVSLDNPEILFAQQTNLAVIRRAELLAELMRLKYGIAIAGTHGKTTTTSMIALILEKAGLDPTVVVGGNANNIGTNARIGHGIYFVAEADESDESFLLLAPSVAVVTNVEEEHLDHYSDLGHIILTFSRFLSKVPFFGCAVVCGDDLNIQFMLRNYTRQNILYGFQSTNDLVARNILCSGCEQSFDVDFRGRSLGRFQLRIPGQHMILNSLAAIGVGIQLEIDIEMIRQALNQYSGVKRRLEIKGVTNDVIVIDDYAHHATEIKATLSAIRSAWNRRVIAVFQPHRYTRTKFFMDDFAKVLSTVDYLILLPVYAASEKPISGVSSESLAEQCAQYSDCPVTCCQTFDQTIDVLVATLHPGDLLVTLGAGNVFQIGEKYLSITGNDPGASS